MTTPTSRAESDSIYNDAVGDLTRHHCDGEDRDTDDRDRHALHRDEEATEQTSCHLPPTQGTVPQVTDNSPETPAHGRAEGKYERQQDPACAKTHHGCLDTTGRRDSQLPVDP